MKMWSKKSFIKLSIEHIEINIHKRTKKIKINLKLTCAIIGNLELIFVIIK